MMPDSLRELILGIAELPPPPYQSVPTRTRVGDPYPVGFRGEGADRQRVMQQLYQSSASVDSVAVFNTLSDVIWPGAVVQGHGLQNLDFDPIPLPRAPGR